MGLTEDLKNIFSKFSDNIVEKLDEIKPKDVQIVQVRQDPDSFSCSELDKVTTTNQKWTNKDKALLTFENPLEKETIVKEISLTPDTTFKTKGKLMITIDDVDVFKSKSFDSFEDIVDLVVTIRKTISQGSKVKFFMISSDGSAVGITALVSFGE